MSFIVLVVYRFAEALFEATEYCTDGIEITSVSPDFRLVVRNVVYIKILLCNFKPKPLLHMYIQLLNDIHDVSFVNCLVTILSIFELACILIYVCCVYSYNIQKLVNYVRSEHFQSLSSIRYLAVTSCYKTLVLA